MAIARAYGMITPNAPDAAMVRAVFAIDPAGIIRAISWYPVTTGRNVGELLRLLSALQVTDACRFSTPEGWQPSNDIILPSPLTAEAVFERHESGSDWYYRTVPLPRGAKPRSRERG